MKISKLLFLIMVLFHSLCFAQTSEEIYYAHNLNLDQAFPLNKGAQAENFVQITQIGSYNSFEISHNSSNVNSKVIQMGSENQFRSFSVGFSTLNETVLQIGNTNSLALFRDNPAIQESNISVFQMGNNHSLSVYGTNDLTKNLVVRMSGNTPGNPLIIRNYN